MNYIVFDLDGCIADDRRRRPLLKNGYDAYHSDMTNDPVVNADAVLAAYETDGICVVFLTARPEKWRHQTESWLLKNFPDTGEADTVLIMRKDDDVRGSVELKTEAIKKLGTERVLKFYDDRADVVAAIGALGIDARILTLPVDASDILSEMGTTYAERNAVYRDNYTRVAPVIKALWPEGVPAELVTEDRWHLFELMVVKLTRFATSGLTHQDSIHDAAVYAAMIESDLRRKN